MEAQAPERAERAARRAGLTPGGKQGNPTDKAKGKQGMPGPQSEDNRSLGNTGLGTDCFPHCGQTGVGETQPPTCSRDEELKALPRPRPWAGPAHLSKLLSATVPRHSARFLSWHHGESAALLSQLRLLSSICLTLYSRMRPQISCCFLRCLPGLQFPL